MGDAAASSIPSPAPRYGGPVAKRTRNRLPPLFTEENGRLISGAMSRMPAGWTALENVVMEDAGLDGDEYLLAHPAYGIVVLDILPVVPTPAGAAEKIRAALARDAAVAKFGGVPCVKMLSIHHLEVAALPGAMGELFDMDGFGAASAAEGEWAEAVRRALKAARIEPRQPGRAMPGPCVESASRFRGRHFMAAILAAGGLAALGLRYTSQPSQPPLVREAQITPSDSQGRAARPEELGLVVEEAASPGAAATAVAPPPAARAVAAPMQADTPATWPSTRSDAALPGTERPTTSPATPREPPPIPPSAVSEMASPSATETAASPPARKPSAAPTTRADPPPAPAPTEETALPSAAAASAAEQPAAAPGRPPSGAPPAAAAAAAAAAALLARGDALIALGDVAAARLVYRRAAALDAARAATAAGRTYDPRFLRAIGAIGVVADPAAAAAWYRKGAALGDGDAAPLLGGLDVEASR